MRWSTILSLVVVAGSMLLVAAASIDGGTAAASEDGPPRATVERVAGLLSAADPLAAGTTSELLAPDQDTERAIFRVGADDAQSVVVRDRALRLGIALNRVDRIQEESHVEQKSLRWWLSLDELDRDVPSGPREALLTVALPDEDVRTAAVQRLVAARAVAERFCRDWNEMDLDAAQARGHAALRAELVEAGKPAIPYLTTLLAVPPQATFPDLHGRRGPTARQQVRALHGLQILDARQSLCVFVFHVWGPSFTQATEAQFALERMGAVTFPEGADEAARRKAIEALSPGGSTRQRDSGTSWELDHFVRHVLRWSREQIASDDTIRIENAAYGPLQLRHLLGAVAFDADASRDAQAARITELEHAAMRACPICIR